MTISQKKLLKRFFLKSNIEKISFNHKIYAIDQKMDSHKTIIKIFTIAN
jgi:hypothetical protein